MKYFFPNKVSTFLGILLLAGWLWTRPALAVKEFNTRYQSDYKINQDVETEVTHRITLTNNLANIYASSYSLIIGSTRISNIRAFNPDGDLNIQVDQTANQTLINVALPGKVVGKDQKQTFSLYYKSLDFASQHGRIFNIGIPQINHNKQIDSLETALFVPDSFGPATFISPSPAQTLKEGDMQKFVFRPNDNSDQSIVAFFGDKQYFSFAISYRLENNRPYPIETEIALLPDTSFQKVGYRTIDPLPREINRDKDGNWLAKYRLDKNSSQEILTSGQVMTTYRPENATEPFNQVLPEHTANQPYWETDDSTIASISAQLKNVKAVYDFVVQTLSYDYKRVEQNLTRNGAVWSIDNPDKAVCMEFTDLFIGLARAKGIPTREVNGYAHTDNPALKPLSLDQDVLHAWPQYFDPQTNLWQDIDPTWENTTGGIDYFHNHDLNRIAFVIHGLQSNYPVAAGSYKSSENPNSKDIEISFVKDLNLYSAMEIIAPSHLTASAGLPFTVQLVFKNTGTQAIYNPDILLVTENPAIIKTKPAELDFLAPLSEKKISFLTQSGNFFSRSSTVVKVFTPLASADITIEFAPIYLYLWQEHRRYIVAGGLLLALLLIRLVVRKKRVN